MNRSWAILLVAVMVSTALPVHSQTSERVQLMDDASGDVRVSTHGQELPNAGRFQNLDIISVHAEEAADDFTFHVRLASGEDVTVPEYGTVLLDFTHKDQSYRIQYDPVNLAGLPSNQRDAMLQRFDPIAESYDLVAYVPSTLEGNELAAIVPRALLIDASGTPPFPGRVLTDFQARSFSFFSELLYWEGESQVEGVQAEDFAPDEPSPILLEVQMGTEQRGHIRLASEEPTRASNGEATTFVYEVEALSLDGADEVLIQFAHVPTGWNAQANAGILPVAEGENATFRVRLDVPFAHQHGVTETFMVEAISVRDSTAIGRLELGVHYLEIAQPSGHHDKLFVHSYARDDPFGTGNQALVGRGGSVGLPFMNTAEIYEGDSNVPSAPSLCSICISPEFASYLWYIPLAPSLRMGIDMDLERLGSGEFEFATGKPLLAARASGAVVYLPPEMDERFPTIDDGTVLATLDEVALGDLDAMSSIGYSPTITPTQAGDYVPYERGGSLALFVVVDTNNPRVDVLGDRPFLEPGAWLQLPLNEYADAMADLSGFVPDSIDEAELEEFEPPKSEVKNSPGPALLLPLAFAMLLRRRS